MPLALDKKPSKRRKVDPRDTYRYTTPNIQPAARPTDPYVAPQPPRRITAVSDLMNALSGFARLYEDHKITQEKEAIAQGETDYYTDTAPPDDAHAARIQKYDELRGKGESYKFWKDATALYMENQTDSPEELAGKMDELLQQYREGKSPAYMKGFIPRAQEILHQIDGLHFTRQKQEYEAEVLASGQAVISGELDRLGLENPQAIRDVITQLQVDSKALGLTRTQVSQMAYDYLSARATVTGDTRYITPLVLRDASGTSIADVVGPDKVASLLHRTEGVQHSRWEMQRAIQREQEAKQQNLLENKLYRKFYELDPNDLDGLMALKTELNAYTSPEGNPEGLVLDSARFNALNNMIEGRQGKGGWAAQSDPEVMVDVLRKAKLGAISIPEIVQKRKQLSYEDARAAIGYSLTHEDKMQNRQEQEATARWKEGQKRAVKLFVGERGPFADLFPTQASQDQKELEENVIRWYQEFQEMWLNSAVTGQYPTAKDIEGAMDYIKLQKDRTRWKDFTPAPDGISYSPTGNSAASKSALHKRLEDMKKKKMNEIVEPSGDKEASLHKTLESMLAHEEGVRNEEYLDSEGHPTVGIGHKITEEDRKKYASANGKLTLTPEQVSTVFKEDIQTAVKAAKQWLGEEVWEKLSVNRQAVVASMAYQMGGAGLSKFVNTKEHILKGEWENVKEHFLASKWHKQTPNRAERMAEIIFQDILPTVYIG